MTASCDAARHGRVLAGAALIALLIDWGAAAGGDRDENGPAADKAGSPAVAVDLIAEHPAWCAGQTNWLGVRFRLSEPWHLYWDGLNDTGLPPAIALTVPDGWTVGEIVWPAPERHLSAGGILDHVYHHDVVLLVPVTVPDAAPAGANAAAATVAGTVKWLACADICVPGKQSVMVTLPWAVAGAEVESGPWRELFDRTRRALPRELPAGAAAAAPVRWRWDGATLVVSAAQATAVEFFPRGDCGALADLITDGSAAGDSLTLRFAVNAGAAADRSVGPARGVLAVTDAAGRTSYWNLSVPTHVAGGGS